LLLTGLYGIGQLENMGIRRLIVMLMEILSKKVNRQMELQKKALLHIKNQLASFDSFGMRTVIKEELKKIGCNEGQVSQVLEAFAAAQVQAEIPLKEAKDWLDIVRKDIE